jgi:hypothetical protein
MYGNYVTNAGACSSSGITGRPDSRDIATHYGSCVTTTGLLVTDKLDLGRFEHCVGRLHHGRKTPALYHS